MRLQTIQKRHFMTQQTTLQETENGELFLQIADDTMDRLGWKEGDDLEFLIGENNTFLLRKSQPEAE